MKKDPQMTEKDITPKEESTLVPGLTKEEEQHLTKPGSFKRPMGRPIEEPSPEVTDKMCNIMRAGAYIETAAAIAGIAKGTLHQWLRKAARKKPGFEIYEDFLNAVMKAAEEAEMRDLAIIDKCANGTPTTRNEKGLVIQAGLPPDWRAAAWRLSRRNPKRWGEKVTLEHSGPGGLPIDVRSAGAVSEEDLKNRIKEIRARRILNGE